MTEAVDPVDIGTIEALASRCRVASPSQPVLHSECAYTFYTPYSTDEGIVVNLNTFMGTIPKLAFANIATTSTSSSTPSSASMNRDVFLRIVKKRIEKRKGGDGDNDNNDGRPPEERKPTKLAIGVEGGFGTDDDKYETITKHSIVVLENPDKVIVEVPFDLNDDDGKAKLPTMVVQSASSVIHHVGLAVQQDLTAWEDDEEVPISQYCTDLPFIDNGVTISPDPKTWKCEKHGTTENLWLNLSDGFVGGGRKNWDGSGGSNGALDHFIETGEKFPLVVKLGTITVEGSTVHADCYSYAKDEDGPVKIPNLTEILAKRGIQVAGLQKTEKSTAELEVELNANYAFDAITESGSKLESVTGPGLQGLVNLGNSCYLNSVLQTLGALTEVSSRYGAPPGGDVTEHRLFRGITPSEAPNSLLVQTTKVVSALTSGAYAMPKEDLEVQEGTTDPKYRLAPRMFKHLIGRDHVDFRTGQQQDAAQFLQYLLEQIDRAEAKLDKSMLSTSHLFSFRTQTRIVCSADNKIKYKDGSSETMWSLRLPMDEGEVITPTSSSNVEIEDEPEQKKLKQDEKVIPTLTFTQCLESWAAESTLDDYRWPHLQNATHPGTQKTRFQTFPRYLWIQAQRYTLDATWQPVKLEVNLDIPEYIDLSDYKASGPQDGEALVPEEGESGGGGGGAPQPEISEMVLGQLMDMGFNMNGCKRALIAVGGSDAEAAMAWIFEHAMDPDFNDPLPEAGAVSSSSPFSSGNRATGDSVDDAIVMSLVDSLGCFTIDQVRVALKETQGAPDRAAEWLFSHMDDLDSAIASVSGSGSNKNEDGGDPTTSSSSPKEPLEDGDGKYTMVGMISHIGKNTGSGHYVAHIKHDGKWVIFNDEKVALSENPPIQHAYLYLFQRTDTVGAPHPKY